MLDYRSWKKKRNLEAQHKYLDDAASIDAQLNEARSKIRSWFKNERREENIIEGKSQLEAEFKRLGINIPEKDLPDFLSDIIHKLYPRKLIVIGPCSIHDPAAALEYAQKLKALSDKVSDN